MKLTRHATYRIVAAVVVMLPLTLYALDVAISGDAIARNVLVGDVAVGGLDATDAALILATHENALRSGARVFTVAGKEFRLSPASVGFDVDIDKGVTDALATRRGANIVGNYLSWLRSFVSPDVVPLPVTFDDGVIEDEFDIWESIAVQDRAFNGSVDVVDGVVTMQYPEPGAAIDRTAGIAIVHDAMSSLDPPAAEIPITQKAPPLTNADIDRAAAEMQEMIDDPIVLRASNVTFRMTFTTEQLAAAVRAVIEERSETIDVVFDHDVVDAIVDPLRDEFEIPPVDARFDIDLRTGAFHVIGSRAGTVLDVDALVAEMKKAALGTGTGLFPIVVGAQSRFTTEQAMAVETLEPRSSFSTEYSKGEPRTSNIQQMSRDVDEAIVLPGDVFSINEHVGQRTEAGGYVAAPAIINGVPYCCDNPANIGGGVSQFATTLFNAVFFSCLEDVEHQPHSLYFTRYPRGREATLGMPRPDVKFRNNTDTPVVIRTWYDADSLSVRLYGDNGGRTCEAITHDKEDIVPYEVELVADPEIAPNKRQRAHGGIDGFLQRVDRVVTYPDGSTEQDLHLVWRYRPLSEQWLVNPCELTGEAVDCPSPVPSVVGSTWEAALDTLARLGFKVAKAPENVADAAQDNIVLRQSHERGVVVDPGTTITLTVGSYSPG